jgi:hypothetical protein
MARPTTLPQQAIDHAAEQAQPHLPTELPPEHDALVFAALEPRTLPSQALENAAEQAHLPTELPAVQSVTLPDAVVEHMSDVAVGHLPDWLIV